MHALYLITGICICTLYLCGCAFADSKSSSTRTVTSDVLCEGRDTVLVRHISAHGDHDTIHYVFSARGVPSVLVARTDLVANVTVDCDKLYNATTTTTTTSTENILSFTSPPLTVFVLLFSQLKEFADVDDVADWKHYNNSWSYNLSDFHWSNISLEATDTVVFTARDKTQRIFSNDGSLTIKMQVFGSDGYGDVLPRLLFNSNTSHVTIVLDKLEPHSEKSRFGLELILVTGADIGYNMSQLKRLSIDDEHSPGSFLIIDWVTDTANNASGAYVSWRPICYTASSLSVASSTQVGRYGLDNHNFTLNSMQASGLAFAYFGSLGDQVHVKSSVVSFGAAEDKKFYNTTQYITWTFAVGLGAPIVEGLSLLIILIISIGLGIPLVLIIISSVFMIMKRCCLIHRQGYLEISGSNAEIN